MNIYFYLIFVWIMVIVSLKVLKDFALTSIFGLLISFFGIYGFASGLSVSDPLMKVLCISHIFIGLYFIVRSSIDLITKDKWKKPNWEVLKLQKKNQKRNQ